MEEWRVRSEQVCHTYSSLQLSPECSKMEIVINRWLREVCSVTIMNNGKAMTLPGVFLPEQAIDVKLQLEKELGIPHTEEPKKKKTVKKTTVFAVYDGGVK